MPAIKGKYVAIFAAMACLLIILIILFQIRLPADIRYIERISALQIPNRVSNIRIYRPREFCLSVKMQLPDIEVENFIQKNNFQLSSNYPLNADLGIDNMFFQTAKPNYYKLTGRTQAHRWEFALDPNKHVLWSVLLFPDAHGDPPP